MSLCIEIYKNTYLFFSYRDQLAKYYIIKVKFNFNLIYEKLFTFFQ